MFEHPKLTAFIDRLDALFREADEFLEDEWGDVYPLHPNRPARGLTENPEMDGLFQIIADFTPGIGSKRGKGYIVSFRAATLETIPPEQFEFLMEQTAAFIASRISVYFPERDLSIVRDGRSFKVVGDFSLGKA